jgi:ligand-binding SRPBCC domain-containing protein
VTRGHRLERVQLIPSPPSAVFAFFSDATNLERITPGFLHFRIVSPRPIRMAAGTLIDYELRLYGLPLRWRTRISSFEPESSFSDLQLRGPYRRWLHRHEFRGAPGGTEMRDVVEYELPLGALGRLAHAVLVRRALERIFDHRREAIAAAFGR